MIVEGERNGRMSDSNLSVLIYCEHSTLLLQQGFTISKAYISLQPTLCSCYDIILLFLCGFLIISICYIILTSCFDSVLPAAAAVASAAVKERDVYD